MSLDLNRITDICLELEGLLYLAKEREDMFLKVKPMMQQKAQEIVALLAEIEPNEESELLAKVIEIEEELAIPETDDIELAPIIEDSIDYKCDNSDDDTNQNHESSRSLRQFFTINDKFRFRRELFGNSDIDFTDCINLVSAMSSYAEAKDYFFSDLSWGPENDEVIEFLSIIESFFKANNKG